MPRLVDCYCQTCDVTLEVICASDEVIRCAQCLSPMEQRWWQRRAQAATVWHPSEWATVFKKPDGTYSFPARADKNTPEGCERITIRSDAEMARVEKAASVRSERRWFNSGSGDGFDTTPLKEVPR